MTQIGDIFLHPNIAQLNMINLAIVATAPVIEKHDLDRVLKPFIAGNNWNLSTFSWHATSFQRNLVGIFS